MSASGLSTDKAEAPAPIEKKLLSTMPVQCGTADAVGKRTIKFIVVTSLSPLHRHASARFFHIRQVAFTLILNIRPILLIIATYAIRSGGFGAYFSAFCVFLTRITYRNTPYAIRKAGQSGLAVKIAVIRNTQYAILKKDPLNAKTSRTRTASAGPFTSLMKDPPLAL